MDDLPAQQKPTQPVPVAGPVGSMAKESTPPVSQPESPLITEIGKEAELPAEVKRSGVSLRPDSIELPPPVVSAGVTPVGPAAAPQPQVTAVPLPLTDDQIAQGLSQGITTSWRWLAEWCERQLKAAHLMVKRIHGKVTRVRE